jgi:hypothetical protein
MQESRDTGSLDDDLRLSRIHALLRSDESYLA